MVSLMSILLMAGTASAAHTLLKEDTFWNLTMVHKWPMSAASLSLKAAEILDQNNESDKQQTAAAGLQQVEGIQAAVAEDPMLQSLKDHAAAVESGNTAKLADVGKIQLLSAPVTDVKADEAEAAQKAQAAIAAKEAAEKAAKAEKAEKAAKAAKAAAEKKAAQSKQQSNKAKETAKKKAAVTTSSAAKAKATTVKQSKKKTTNVGSSKPAAAKTSASKSTSIITTPSGKTYNFKKQLSMQATAYTAAASENGKWGAVDYFGNKLKVGTVAVDPKVIPLGTKLYITGYKYAGLPKGGMIAVASDMGGAIKGNRIDVFVPDSRSEALAFGIQQLKVYVIE